jgi:hypothetical protein
MEQLVPDCVETRPAESRGRPIRDGAAFQSSLPVRRGGSGLPDAFAGRVGDVVAADRAEADGGEARVAGRVHADIAAVLQVADARAVAWRAAGSAVALLGSGVAGASSSATSTLTASFPGRAREGARALRQNRWGSRGLSSARARLRPSAVCRGDPRRTNAVQLRTADGVTERSPLSLHVLECRATSSTFALAWNLLRHEACVGKLQSC